MTDMEQRKVFSRNLNRFLREKNKTQKEVADAIGVLPQTFNTWAKGIAIPRMGKIQALAEYFHINKSELIDESQADTSIVLSYEEEDLIEAYRKASPDTQQAVRNVLGIKNDSIASSEVG